jgi:hypothetical protein
VGQKVLPPDGETEVAGYIHKYTSYNHIHSHVLKCAKLVLSKDLVVFVEDVEA